MLDFAATLFRAAGGIGTLYVMEDRGHLLTEQRNAYFEGLDALPLDGTSDLMNSAARRAVRRAE